LGEKAGFYLQGGPGIGYTNNRYYPEIGRNHENITIQYFISAMPGIYCLISPKWALEATSGNLALQGGIRKEKLGNGKYAINRSINFSPSLQLTSLNMGLRYYIMKASK
jgi:hypothetical protein